MKVTDFLGNVFSMNVHVHRELRASNMLAVLFHPGLTCMFISNTAHMKTCRA